MPTYTPQDIRSIRKRLRLTQQEFGQLLGCSAKTASSWESGYRNPSGTARTAITQLARRRQAPKRRHRPGTLHQHPPMGQRQARRPILHQHRSRTSHRTHTPRNQAPPPSNTASSPHSEANNTPPTDTNGPPTTNYHNIAETTNETHLHRHPPMDQHQRKTLIARAAVKHLGWGQQQMRESPL